MGKEWLSWAGGGGGSGGGNSRSSNKTAAGGGCMSALFHLHRFHFPSTHRNHSNTYPFLQEQHTTTTGVEAPRNSLELNETAATKQQEGLIFPEGRIKTQSSKIRLDEISTSDCNSPGTKTPSVVARLMGLDLLPHPECTSPSITKSRKDTALLQIYAAHSLPETPRTSSSSRKSDVERHRLSLQLNKENAFSPSDGGRLRQDDKKIRSVGLDITNTHRNSDQSKRSWKFGEEQVKQSNATKLVQRNSSSYEINHQSKRVLNKIPVVKERQQQHEESKKVSGKCKKLPVRAAASRREDGFVGSRERNKSHLAQNKCKKSRLSRDILKVNGPTLVQVKIGAAPSLAKLPQKQSQVSEALISWKSSTQLSSKPSQPYSCQLQLRHDKTSSTTVSECSGAAALHGGASPEKRNYIQMLLKHSGIINQANPIAKWHSPSQPIDPRLFHHLELKAATGLSHRWERKMIFQLVDELLAENLSRQFKMNRRISPFGGSRLVEELCKKVGNFPAAKCVVLEDIDSLIDKDLSKPQWDGFWGEEEEMVREIEGEIVEWLVCEAVAVMGGDAAEELVFAM
ncbi:uncharacterized protein LOC131014522 [Salvia miltiorrhiza]|uniref:uncharacterized protein LOC131014522 n=1 Tax=Salvia miltiorrhiza TaxID=226208 RepID=UPI0025AC3AA7|nr:uncharacterized protein LOC131014522 [Salvia miltiorrhiza]